MRRTLAMTRGMSFVEVVVASAILAIVFGGLLLAFQLTVNIIGSSKAKSGALALANERIEYVRSLQYNSIGTVGGIPDGSLSQNATVTLNGITYSERTLIQYVDDPDDGLGAADTNGILADYKLVKVEYSWNEKGTPKSISLVTNIVPNGIETTAGGGTLTVHVFDATVQPVSGAEVHVYNNNGTSTIDTTRYTNVNGIAMVAGAPALAGYEITATNPGYSTDQTYSASSSNPNPITPHVAVLESEVSTMNFQIDLLSDLIVETISPPTIDSFDDLFDDTGGIATSTETVVIGGAAQLAGGAGSYSASGTVLSNTVSPASIESWNTLSYDADIPANTGLTVQLYDLTGTTTPQLILDTDLPGNSAGFAPGTVDISMLDPGTFTDLALFASLTSSDVATTSKLLEWHIDYTESETPIGNVQFILTGNKTIGTTASGSPVYKYQETLTTDGGGSVTLFDLEWDVYDIILDTGAYDIAEACDNIPYSLDPDANETLKLTLDTAAARSLRVYVENSSGDPVPGATALLTRPGYSDSGITSVCGQTFFNSALAFETDYQLDVSATGYNNETITDITVEDDESIVVLLIPS